MKCHKLTRLFHDTMPSEMGTQRGTEILNVMNGSNREVNYFKFSRNISIVGLKKSRNPSRWPVTNPRLKTRGPRT